MKTSCHDASARHHIADIRPLRLAIFNIMPTKIATETQLLRLLSNTPIQVDITLLHPQTYPLFAHARRTSAQAFYKTFDDVRDEKFDGMILTGAPVETLDFTDVLYWPEL